MPGVQEIVDLYARRGHSQYGGEAVTQLEHALQAAMLAEQENASPELIVAALLHDLGHLLHDLPVDAPDAGIDDHHENSARRYLLDLLPPSVTEPIRLHVAAKRYLCATDAAYFATLSHPSIVSLALQGGKMTAAEAAEFEKMPRAADAIRLRRWDDAAKIPNYPTPSLEHFAGYLRQVVLGDFSK
jgi:phosphonate degradation associated HDIG domain protein